MYSKIITQIKRIKSAVNLRNRFHQLENFGANIAKLSILSFALLVTMNATGRYGGGWSIPDLVILSEMYIIPAMIFFYLSKLERDDNNVRVDMIWRFYPDWLKSMVSFTYFLVLIPIFTGIIYLSLLRSIDAHQTGSVLGVLSLPTSVGYIIPTIGFSLLTIRLIIKLLKELLKLKSETTNRLNWY
jgi:TRAP-type C4-dicarboxylate transport system permease small subunit